MPEIKGQQYKRRGRRTRILMEFNKVGIFN